MTTVKVYEVGVWADDSWELIGDFTTLDEATAAMVTNGDGTYGVDDRDGGHYNRIFIVVDGVATEK